MNLFDIVRQSGGGDGFAALAKQFGLSEDQVARAAEAFMPALSAGLKRKSADPLGFADLMQRLALGGYPQAFQSPNWAFGAGRPQGDDALTFLFGSPAVIQALTAQVSAFTGMAQGKLNELLPAFAAMTFGGLARQASPSNPLLEAMMKQFAAAPEANVSAKGPLDRYEDEQKARKAPAADLAGAHGDLMKAGMAALETGASAWRQTLGGVMGPTAATPEAESSGGAFSSGGDVFGEMLEPGRRLGEAYQREMEAVLDGFRPATSRS